MSIFIFAKLSVWTLNLFWKLSKVKQQKMEQNDFRFSRLSICQ